MTLPKYITIHQKHFIDYLENKKEFNIKECSYYLENYMNDTQVRSLISNNCRRLKWIKKTGYGTYVVTVLGKRVIRERDKIPVKDRKMPERKKTTQPQPEPQVEINLSSTADLFANTATALLAENQDLRKLLLEVHTRIGRALELDKENDNGISSTET